MPESLLLVVPSFAWPSKLGHGTELYPGQLEVDDFGLQPINYIPSMVGTYIGFLSLPWLIVLFAVLGLVFGWFERWLLKAVTPVRVILLCGAVAAALWYEAGLPIMLVQMRAARARAFAAKVAELVLRGHVARTRTRRPLGAHEAAGPGAVPVLRARALDGG